MLGFVGALVNSPGSGIVNGGYPEPSREDRVAGEQILHTLHSNLESMIIIINHSLKVDNANEIKIVYKPTFSDSPFLYPTMKTNFGNGKLELVSTATIGSGKTELSNPIAEINIECPNVFSYYNDQRRHIKKIQSYYLPILRRNENKLHGEIRPFLLSTPQGGSTLTDPDGIVTSYISMIVNGLIPIFDFFSGETGWKHYISNERIKFKEGLSLTVTSKGGMRTRITVIHGDTDCKSFEVTHRGETQKDLDFEKLKTNIHEYLNAPQFRFFARYQSLTERVARLME